MTSVSKSNLEFVQDKAGALVVSDTERALQFYGETRSVPFSTVRGTSSGSVPIREKAEPAQPPDFLLAGVDLLGIIRLLITIG